LGFAIFNIFSVQMYDDKVIVSIFKNNGPAAANAAARSSAAATASRPFAAWSGYTESAQDVKSKEKTRVTTAEKHIFITSPEQCSLTRYNRIPSLRRSLIISVSVLYLLNHLSKHNLHYRSKTKY
jgi:hypothetical protein